jgi:hypothetical protein
MTGLVFSVRVRLLSADLGGRNWPVISDYRPRWTRQHVAG